MITKASDIQDVVNTYLEDPLRGVIFDASRPYQNYQLCNFFFPKKKNHAASPSFTWVLLTGDLENTQASAIFSKDTTNRVDVTAKMTGYWHFQNTHFLVSKLEPAMQSMSKDQIYNYLNAQELAMQNDFYKKNEDWLGTLAPGPNDGTAGEILPYGLPFHLAKSTTAAFGFNGGDDATYATTCGLAKDDNAGLKHGTGTYSSDFDMEDKLNDATDLCDFQSPYEGAGALGEKQLVADYKLISTRAPFKSYQELLYSMNDNIGADAGKFRSRAGSDGGGMVYYKGIPWCWSAAMSKVAGVSRDTLEPIYGLKQSTWEMRCQNGLFMKKDELRALDNSHTTFKQFFDTSYQLVCHSYRDNFVLAASVASSS